jgi:hypothetical protein
MIASMKRDMEEDEGGGKEEDMDEDFVRKKMLKAD